MFAYSTPPSTDNQAVTRASFLGFVETQLARESESNDLIADRVLHSFAQAPGADRDGTGFDTDRRNIRNWLGRLIQSGASPATVRRYLGKMRTLYAAYAPGSAEADTLFAELREQTQGDDMFRPFADAAALEYIKRIPAKLDRLTGPDANTASLLLYILCGGDIPLPDAINAKFETAGASTRQCEEIIERQRKERPKAQYIFALEQGKHRPERLAADVNAAIAAFIRLQGYTLAAPLTPDTIRGWWIEAALGRGLDPAHIAAMLPAVPPTHPWFALLTPATLSQDERRETLQTVADAILPGRAQWYALYMRDRHTPADIQQLLSPLPTPNSSLNLSPLPTPHSPLPTKPLPTYHLFYPTRTQYKQVGRKRVKEEIPYLPRILFVRTRPDKVLPLMGKVGRIAWCYKTTNKPGAPYAVIPDKAMANFQRFIGVLEPDTKIEFIKNSELKAGQRVRITGGPAKGCEGEIIREATHSDDPDLRTFILRIANDLTLKWEARIPEPYLLPL